MKIYFEIKQYSLLLDSFLIIFLLEKWCQQYCNERVLIFTSGNEKVIMIEILTAFSILSQFGLIS